MSAASQAIARLAEQFRSQPNWKALVTALVSPADSIENVAIQLYLMTFIDQATGVQLDVLGKRVGELRQGFDDATYRLHIKARIWLNRGSGNGEEVYSMFRLLLPTSTFWLETHYPAAYTLHAYGAVDPTIATYLATFLQDATSLGVNTQFHWSEATPANTFTFFGGVGQGFENGLWSTSE